MKITEMDPPWKQRVRFEYPSLYFSNNKMEHLLAVHMQGFPSEKILDLKNTFHTMVYYFPDVFQ